jgi:hypothetical protein
MDDQKPRLLASQECREGKHRICPGDGWDERTDTPAPCPCTHHVRTTS